MARALSVVASILRLCMAAMPALCRGLFVRKGSNGNRGCSGVGGCCNGNLGFIEVKGYLADGN